MVRTLPVFFPEGPGSISDCQSKNPQAVMQYGKKKMVREPERTKLIGPVGSSGDTEKWRSFGYFLEKVEPTGFPDRLHVGCETKRGITVDFRFLAWAN